MANVYQSFILDGLINFLNANAETLSIPNIEAESLSTGQDSIALSVVSGDGSTERLSDVTGTAYTGTLNITVRYRIMQSVFGDNDLQYEDTLNSVYQFLRENRSSITYANAFIDAVEQTTCGHIASVYSGGVKDYEMKLKITYERW